MSNEGISMKSENPVITGLWFLSFFACFVIFIGFTCVALKHTRAYKYNIQLKIWILSFIGLIVTIILCLTRIGSRLAQFSRVQNTSFVSSIAFFGMSEICCYLLYINRLRTAFKHTKYESSMFIIMLLYSLIGLFGLSIVVNVYCFYRFINLQMDDTMSWGVQRGILSVVQCLTSLNFCVILMYMFSKKLLAVIGDLTDVNENLLNKAQMRNVSEITLPSTFELNANQENLLDIVTKYFVLSFWGTITTQLMLISFIVTDFSYLQSIELATTLENVSDCFWMMHSIANSLCFVLFIDVGGPYYIKCCSKCHKCTKKYCSKYANTLVRRHTLESLKNIKPENALKNDFVLLIDDDLTDYQSTTPYPTSKYNHIKPNKNKFSTTNGSVSELFGPGK